MSRTLVIDNGSYSVKIGYAHEVPADGDQASNNSEPQVISNAVVRTKDKRLIIGRLIDRNQNISGCYFKRPFERNQLTSWEFEKLIWDYCFNSRDLGLNVDPRDTSLILTEAPFTLPKISKNMDQVVFEEYGFRNYYKNIAASFVPFNWRETEKLYNDNFKIDYSDSKPYKDYQLVIDSGFDATYVVPIIYGVVYWDGIKKLDIGGRFLTGFLRELISFRYYDVTDESILVNSIKEQTCFVPRNYNRSLEKLKHDKTYNSRSISDSNMVVEYALPDFKTTTKGYLLTDAIRKQQQDTLEDLQIMKLYDERFSVPETLFDPAIANVKHRAGLVKAVHDAIYACPELIRPLLVSNIVCVGGNFNFPGFKERLELELKLALPVEWDIRIAASANPTTYAWRSANMLANNADLYGRLCVSKDDYFENGWNYVREKFECKLSGWN